MCEHCKLFSVLGAVIVLSALAVQAGEEPFRELRMATVDPGGEVPIELLQPEGRSRWDLEGIGYAGTWHRTLRTDADGTSLWRIDVAADGRVLERVRFSDPLGGDAAVRWLFPDRDPQQRLPGTGTAFRVTEQRDGSDSELWIEVRQIGIGWLLLPERPREVVLQRVTVSRDSGGGFVPEQVIHRWVDPRAGPVAEIAGAASPDGRGRVGFEQATVVDEVLAGAAGLKIYADELDIPINRNILYGWNRGDPTPISSLTPDMHATAGELINASSWDFSGNTSGTVVVSTRVDPSLDQTCNYDSCGYLVPNGILERADIDVGGPDEQYNNRLFEREDRASDVTIWLRAGAQNEGTEGSFGTGESRFCWISEGGETRTEVPQWRFANQDARGFFLQHGDSWDTGPNPIGCEQNLYNMVCDHPGIFFNNLWVKNCEDHAGKQSGEVLNEGVVTLPSGHTLNALLVRTVADFCVYLGSSCFFDTDQVRTVVLVWQVPHIGTAALIQSPQEVAPDLTSWTAAEFTDIRFGLFPPLSIQVDGTTDTTIDISWNPGNDTSRINAYKVYWDTDSGSIDDYAFNSGTHPGQVTFAGTSATISGLTAGTDYFITVTSLSDYANPGCTDPTPDPGECSAANPTIRYESIRFPTQVSGDPSFVYPIEVQGMTTGGACTPTTEVTGLTVGKVGGGDIEICWDPVSDPCLSGYQILGANTPESDANFNPVADLGLVTCWTGNPTESFFLVVAKGTGGNGPWGHYGR
jgi:hypothetical protein